jgi:hypothetical protein
MTEIDKSYRKQSIEKFDVDLPYIDLSFFDNLPSIKKNLKLLVISALLIPFLPPLRHYSSKWTEPASFGEYYGRIKNVFYLFVIIFGFILVKDVLSNFRTLIDRRFGYKKIGIFEARSIWNLSTKKVVFLNNGHVFILNQKDNGFSQIKVGELLKIERTATHKLMGYRITK